MVNLIEDNIKMNYRVYNSKFITNNIGMIRYEGNIHHANYRKLFSDSKKGSTWDYNMYNIFSLASGSNLFYQIYKELLFVIKDYLKDQLSQDDDYSTNIWFQSWLNYHKQTEVLDWHDHFHPYHGYISIDPKDSTTEFRGYSVKNKIGNIYIGPGNREHRVLIDTPYQGSRITLGYDIATTKTLKIESRKSLDMVPCNLSFIPVI